MDIKDIFKYNNSYAFRLTFFSIDFQDDYAKKLQNEFPEAMLAKHLLNESDKSLIDIDAVAGSLDISVEEILSQPIYEFIWQEELFSVYVSPYFVYGIKKNKKAIVVFDDLTSRILRGFNKQPVSDVSACSFTCILNVTDKMTLEQVQKTMKMDAFPMLDLDKNNGGRYVDSLNIDEDLNLDIVRTIERLDDDSYLWRISMNENLYFQKMDQIDAVDVYSEMFEESKEKLVELFN